MLRTAVLRGLHRHPVMPEQKSFTVEGTQVLWKHYRKKQGKEDVIKFCFGKALPEKQWATHHIPHATVNACTTSTALAAAVRSLAGEILGATIKPPKSTGCRCAPLPLHGAKALGRQSPTADAAAGLSEPRTSESAIAVAAAAIASATHLLIAAGAGFSADSGLPVYADIAAVPEYAARGLTYQELCTTQLLVSDPAAAYGFWRSCAAQYRRATPHEGYAILERWPAAPLQPTRARARARVRQRLIDSRPRSRPRSRSPMPSPSPSTPRPLALARVAARPDGRCYVYTSNVDGHFRRSAVLGARLHEIHGCTEDWMCAHPPHGMRGCNPARQRLQPRGSEAATPCVSGAPASWAWWAMAATPSSSPQKRWGQKRWGQKRWGQEPPGRPSSDKEPRPKREEPAARQAARQAAWQGARLRTALRSRPLRAAAHAARPAGRGVGRCGLVTTPRSRARAPQVRTARRWCRRQRRRRGGFLTRARWQQARWQV